MDQVEFNNGDRNGGFSRGKGSFQDVFFHGSQ